MDNFIIDADLKVFFPNLNNQIWRMQTTYQKQIEKAFDILQNDLHNMNIKSERIGVLDLGNEGPNKNVKPVVLSVSGSATGSAIASHYDRRIVADTQTVSGSWTLFIDGNRSRDLPEKSNLDWEVGASFAITASNTTITTVMNRTYNWLRYRLEPEDSGSIDLSVRATTNLFDDCIAHKALEIIFRSFRAEVGDIWDKNAGEELQAYEYAKQQAKISYDRNETGDITPEETNVSTCEIELVM